MRKANITISPLLLVLVLLFKFSNGQPKINKTQHSNEYQNINCGIEDHAGNFWFGSSGEGVYRYDGTSFSQFSVQNGLSSNTVSSILEDRQHNIWVGTKMGLCRFNGKEMIPIPLYNNLPFQFFCIMQDSKGILWFGTAEGVLRYDGKSFSSFLDNPRIVNDSNLTLKSIQCMFEDKKGNIWFGSGPMAFEGLGFYNGKKLTRVSLKKENWIRAIMENEGDKLLVATRHNGVVAGDESNFSSFHQPPQLKNDLFTCTFKDSHGNIWYGSDYLDDRDIKTGGCWRFDGKSFTSYTKKDGLSNSSIAFFMEDRKGNIWIGTRNTGLYCFDGKAFKQYGE